MSYCINPDCPKPQNPDEHIFCQSCGLGLLLAQGYRALQIIAQGDFVSTFLAKNEDGLLCVLKQLVVKKIISSESQKALALFQQEIQLLAELGQHPQLPTLFAHFEANQCLYSVQEFMAGSNLTKLLEQEGTFSEIEIWQLLDDILPILNFIHQHQVIHRDIKPQNIILNSFFSNQGQGRRGKFVLVDFGIAKLVTDRGIIQKDPIIGSPEYAAPEQIRGQAVFASDLYSLGVTCIYLLTGIAPFELFDVVNDCWAWQDYLTEKISGRLITILDKLLTDDLTKRFDSAQEVMQTINPQKNNLIQDAIFKPAMLWKCKSTLEANSAINAVAISPDGKLLASGGDDKNIGLWQIETRAAMAIFTGHLQAIKSVAFSPDGTTLASGSDDRTVKLWNINECQEICTFKGHSNAVKSVVFSPDGTILASGSWDKTIKLWNLKGGLEQTLTGHNLQVTAVAFSACGQFLASASCDRTVRLWHLSSGSSFVFKGHIWAVLAVAFSPDGKMLASGSDDNTVILWDRKTKKALYTFSGHSWSVTSIAFTPDNELLFSGSWDKTIKLWNLKTGKEIGTLNEHLDSVCAIAVSLNGKMIASGSKDQTLKLWHRDESPDKITHR